ncbi:uncharacterized protein LOC6542149 [Drosophila erecta]|uniref:Uncharacterized protein n=1 Tax=Drosophila erecta TaxID=7220 RepID=B3N4G9_DROER|nr:uncharacterized protein LOC6542149 [Drosophila erecta]EDV58881.1 uncharacterized protein Dere_GG23730 [Drosophila erecta]
MNTIVGELFRLLSVASGFLLNKLLFYGLIFGLLILIVVRLFMMERLQRLKAIIWRNLSEYERDSEAEDEGCIDDEFLFRDLNPEQSVDLHRRQRLEAAAKVLRKVSDKEGSFKSPQHRRKNTEPIKSR